MSILSLSLLSQSNYLLGMHLSRASEASGKFRGLAVELIEERIGEVRNWFEGYWGRRVARDAFYSGF
jgi:hypothetical protein